MRKHRYISREQYEQALAEPLQVQAHSLISNQDIGYASELARLAMVEKFVKMHTKRGIKSTSPWINKNKL